MLVLSRYPKQSVRIGDCQVTLLGFREGFAWFRTKHREFVLKLHQEIIIDGVIVTVTRFDKGMVRLGFIGPRSIAVYREEVYQERKSRGV